MYLHLNFLSQLTQFLFRERELPYGQDLISLNIHRGRDMGLNDYNSYRELFGLPKAWSFEQMSDVLPRDVMAALHFHFFDCLCLFVFSLPFSLSTLLGWSNRWERRRPQRERVTKMLNAILTAPLFHWFRFVLIRVQVVDSMKTLYQHPDDVDLYIAGMSETVKPEGSLVGHTFSHIIAQQFARLKQADSYFYELGGQPSSFTPGQCHINLVSLASFHGFWWIPLYPFWSAQLDEIRKTSLASILCGNGDDILHMPSLTFVSISSMWVSILAPWNCIGAVIWCVVSFRLWMHDFIGRLVELQEPSGALLTHPFHVAFSVDGVRDPVLAVIIVIIFMFFFLSSVNHTSRWYFFAGKVVVSRALNSWYKASFTVSVFQIFHCSQPCGMCETDIIVVALRFGIKASH